MMKRFDAIAFDLDGTLIDSAGASRIVERGARDDEGLAGFARTPCAPGSAMARTR